MISNAPNRITELLPETDPQLPAPAPKPRTPAQQEASRHNGGKSRGPATDAGKAISRLNARKHGLFSRLLCPPHGIYRLDRVYRQALAELTDEWQPQTFTAKRIVENLAWDFVQLARARRYVELLQKPVVMPEDANSWEETLAMRRDLELAKGMAAELDGGQPLRCRSHAAATLANAITNYVKSLHDFLIPPAGEEYLPEEDMDEFEREDVRKASEEWKMLQPSLKRLSDPAYLAAVFAGQVRAGVSVTKRLRMVLEGIIEARRRFLKNKADVVNRLECADDSHALQLAQDPQALMTLQAYISRIEGSIRHKLRDLRQQ
jgi:hypothetical protein